ncbi:FadR/GntR family transcriptional regulator [Nonomuraea africana]|uniref:DNA-binding FadR family transcriptional regulator n=1 Tax=Nonomuraea africana TaxID=46171 RepID=A0ABR9KBZ2_9ACTN|nr:FCD domain-containing protein [Nonomuraea africana]MBE1559450.1 DNA-binding FadR family transcriptional regulator [Nonomuraea africana]
MNRLPDAAVFAPVDDGSGRVEVVVRRLAEAIALGLIADGDQLPAELELAASLNVSTVTLRAALAALRERGLVETRRGRGGGTFVRGPADPSMTRLRTRLRELSTSELREIGDYRAAIAGTAARLAAQRASADNVTRLHQLVDRLAAATSVGERRRADGRFHIEVAAAAQSVRLTRAEIDIQSEVGELLWLPYGEAVDPDEVVRSHRQVIDAIAAREADRARTLTEEHLDRGTERLMEFHWRLVTQDAREWR